MKIERLLIVPDREQMEKSIALTKQYGCGFEFDDFYLPSVLDNETLTDEIISGYLGVEELPKECTLHGAFFDVTPFSDDPKIVEVSDFRIEQSLCIARKIGAKAVVFHTNFVPNFMVDYYCANWVERNEQYWKEKLEKYDDIMIYIENMFDMSYDLLQKLAQRLSGYSNFGVCFDYAHAHAFGDETQIEAWVKALSPYIKHVHINDNDCVADLHLALGEGKIDWHLFKKYYETYFPYASVLIEMKDLAAAEKSLEFIGEL